MGKVNIDLASIFGLWGDKTPQANPDYGATYDFDSGNWLDSNKNQITDPEHLALLNKQGDTSPAVAKQPYTTPSGWTQTFHHDVANFEQKANIDAIQAAWKAQNAQDLQNTMAARQSGIARNEGVFTGTPLTKMSDLGAGIATRGDFGASSVNNAESNLAALNQNIPALNADADKAALQAKREEDINRYIKAAVAGSLGVPRSAAINESTGLDYSTGRYNTGIANEPFVGANERMTLQNNMTRNAGEAAALPDINRSLLNNAQISSSQSGQALLDRPYTSYAEHLNAVQRADESNYGPGRPYPLGTQYNPDGTVNYGVHVPGSLTEAQLKMAGVNSLNPSANEKFIDKATGRPVPTPPSPSVPAMRGSIAAKPAFTPKSDLDVPMTNKPTTSLIPDKVDNTVFNETVAHLPSWQRDIAFRNLRTELAAELGIKPSYYGSSVFRHSLDSTMQDELQNPDTLKKISNLKPEKTEEIYKKALAGALSSTEPFIHSVAY